MNPEAIPSPSETPIAVAIINFNTRDHLQTCLATVRSESPEEVIVVDNGSTDGSIEMVQSDYPEVMLHVDPTNPGYGAAANRAIANCKAPYVLLLNSDTLLASGALKALSGYLDRHPRAAIAGPRILNPDGTLQPSCFPFPSPLTAFLGETHLGYLIRYVPGLRNTYLRTWRHNRSRTVPWVLGAALAIRCETFEAVGGFDPSYFMYFEEVDLCYRLYAAGHEVHFTPVASIMHTGKASTKQRRADMTVQFYVSMMQFYRRHYSKAQLVQLIGIVKITTLTALIRDTLRLPFMRNPQKFDAVKADITAWQRILLERLEQVYHD